MLSSTFGSYKNNNSVQHALHAGSHSTLALPELAPFNATAANVISDKLTREAAVLIMQTSNSSQTMLLAAATATAAVVLSRQSVRLLQ